MALALGDPAELGDDCPLTLPEAAAWLGCSREQVLAAADRGDLPSVTVGSTQRFSLAGLRELATAVPGRTP